MNDQFLSILNDFCDDESMSVVSNRTKEILHNIQPRIARSFLTVVKDRNDPRCDQLFSSQYILKENKNLLHFVAKDGTVETANRLLQYGVDGNVTNIIEKTPIFYAIENSADMVKVFLDISKVNDWDLFRQALIHGSEETFGLLVNKSLREIGKISSEGEISDGNEKLDALPNIQKLILTFLRHELHLSNMEESFPLLIFFAARFHKKGMLRMILKHCRRNLGKINQQKKMRHQTLYEPQAAKELNIQGRLGETALHYAVRHQNSRAVRFLLGEGADPNSYDFHKCTPLHFAACLQHKEICQLLLTYGANVNPNFVFPENPLQLVCGETNAKHLMNLEKHYYNDKIEDFSTCCSRYNHDLMILFLKLGADGKNEAGVPFWFKLFKFGQMEEVEIIAKYIPRLEVLDADGKSTLHHAALEGSLEIVDYLLEKGLDVDLRRENSNTPFLTLVEANDSCHVEMMKYLVYRGANISALNERGKTALQFAIERNSILVLDLLELGADWLVLGEKEPRFCHNFNVRLTRMEEVFISFIALRNNELSDHIKFYVINNEQTLNEAFNYFANSKLEIAQLKTMTISEGVRTSYFDFLTKDFYSCVQIAKNSDLKKFLNSSRCYEVFPCYGSLLKHRFQLAQNLENDVDQTFDFILDYTNLLPEIVEIIVGNFRSIDFRVFGRVLSNAQC